MSNRFHKIEESHCVLRDKGVFRQTECYMYKGYVHAKLGSGFVRLYKADPIGVQGTSKPGVSWDSLYISFPVTSDNTGAIRGTV